MGEQVFTTLCYVERDGKYLMLHRTKKEHDINKDKYIGIGGHIEHGETPGECILREAQEEAGLKLLNPRLRGLITFVIDDMDEYSFLYTCTDFLPVVRELSQEANMVTEETPECRQKMAEEQERVFYETLPECREGDLVWVEKDKIFELPLWEGDKVFFRLLNEREDFFSLKLVYVNDVLKDVKIDE